MDQVETIRFDELYQRHLRLLKLQGAITEEEWTQVSVDRWVQ